MNSKIKNAEDLLYASQNGYDRLMNEVHHDGNTKENRIAAKDRSAVERGPCAVGLGRVDAAVFQGHHLCVPRYTITDDQMHQLEAHFGVEAREGYLQ